MPRGSSVVADLLGMELPHHRVPECFDEAWPPRALDKRGDLASDVIGSDQQRRRTRLRRNLCHASALQQEHLGESVGEGGPTGEKAVISKDECVVVAQVADEALLLFHVGGDALVCMVGNPV